MADKPRSEVFDPDVVGVYHCFNQAVQQRFLFGKDELSGKDYSYRKAEVREQFRELAGVMAVEVLDFAILDNHLHVVLRNRPDIVKTWSDEEVAERWYRVCPPRRNADGSVPDPKPCEIKLLLPDVEKYREQLSHISWMMRLGTQRIARRANQEDETKGHFFAGRYQGERLETELDVLMELHQYLALLDSLGRVLRADKRGSIPDHLPPILERLGTDPQTWVDSFLDRFGSSRWRHPPPPSPAAAAS